MQTEVIKTGGIKTGGIKIEGIKVEGIKIKIIKTRAVIVFLLLAVLLLTALFSGCSSSVNSNSSDTSQNPEQSRGEGRGEQGEESGAAQQPNSSPISRGAINNEYTPGSGRLIVKLEILDNLISYESVSFARVHITPQDIDASFSIDVALSVGDESARLDFGYVAFGRYFLNATIYHSNGNALAYSELLINVGLEGDTQIDSSQTGDAEIQIEDIRPSPDATDPSLAEYTATLVFDSSSALFRLVTLPLVFNDYDNDGLLDVWHPAYLAAITSDLDGGLDGSYELTADLDLSSYSNWQPLGSEDQPFRGTFVGNGHRLSGLSSKGYMNAGLFGVVEGASITDLIVEAWQISSLDYDNSNAGAIAGFARSSNFVNITVMMSSYDDELSYITAVSQDDTVSAGGLFGRFRNSTIANAKIMAAGLISGISSKVEGSAKVYVGGLAGYVYRGSDIINAEVMGKVDVQAGGIFGNSTGDYKSGGLIGRISSSRLRETKIMISGNITTHNGDYLTSGGAMAKCGSSSVVDMDIVIVGNILAENPTTEDSVLAAGVIGENSNCSINNVTAEILGSIRATSTYAKYAFSGGLQAGGENKYVTDVTQISDVMVTVHGDVLSSGKKCDSGGLGGRQDNNININNSSVTIYGDIIAGNLIEGDTYFTCSGGGMFGSLSGGVINSSYAIINGDVRSYSHGRTSEAGGMVGVNIYPLEIMNSYALIKGNLDATSFIKPVYVGGFVGNSYGSLNVERNDYVSSLGVRDSYVQILGNMTLRSILPEDNALSYGGNFIGIGKISIFTNTYAFVGGAISAIIDSTPAAFGGIQGRIIDGSFVKAADDELHNISLTSSYYKSERELSEDNFNSADADGDAISAARSDLQLRCPQAAGENCGGPVMPGNPQTYVGWDESVWDFGTADELPRLRIFSNINILN